MNNSTPSSSSLTYKWTYDVFISFRGPDVRKRFIGYLYQKLCEIKEVKTFMDDPTIEPGEQIDETLIKAIQESRIGLVVFSANYASSSFCLDELAKIIECSIDQKSMLFLPVFYEVDPSVLRHQLGSYEEALTKHEARFGKEKTQVWRKALNKAAGVSGFSSDNYKYDSDLIGDITQSITKKISKLREGDKNQLISNSTGKNRVNPRNAPLVVGQLLDEECPENFIEGLILSVGSLLPDKVVEECEKSHSLPLFTQSLEHLVSKGSRDVHVHNALAKIMIYSNNDPENFLIIDSFYDSRVIGKFCEKRDPTLAVVAYQKGQCDDELVNVTNKNSLFKLQARYVVERMDDELWEKVLNPKNEFRRQLIDQVVSTAMPESSNPTQVSSAVKGFMNMNLSHELIELLENIVLRNTVFSGNFNLQNLLILTAMKADTPRVMNYIKMLDNFDGPAIGEVAVEAELYEEAFSIFKKFNLNVLAVNVLLDNLRNIDRAVEFASLVEEDDVWTQVANAQLRESSFD